MNTNIDESLYSRQLYTIGRDAMNKLSSSSILIACQGNFSGLAVEVAKCAILAGVSKVFCNAKTDCLSYDDIATNYYASIDDIGKPFMDKVIENLASLNPYVYVNNIKNDKDIYNNKFDCIVFCDYNKNELIGLNIMCRELNTKFIAISSYGLSFNMFCDFGENHVVTDINGENPKFGMIKKFENNKVICSDEHKLFYNDVINIDPIDNLKENVNFHVKIIDKFSFKLFDSDKQHVTLNDQYTSNISFKQIKIPTILNFKTLDEALKNKTDDLFVRFDTANWNMPFILNSFMCAMDDWKNDYDVYPTYENIKPYFLKYYNGKEDYSDILEKLIETSNGKICGVDAICGAMCAQEIIKACSNKFMPTKQFLHFEALNILHKNYLDEKKHNPNDYKPIGSRYDSQIKIFGKKYMEILHNKKIFIVGSGAIGCEHLKNFCMMGIKNMVITDMDRIENSNLNRQFLFRKEDIGLSKSMTASKKAKKINNDVNIIAYENKIGDETVKNVYTSEFFNKIDIITTALDNVDARLFVDKLCIKYDKPMIDSGTLGTKGSIQCSIPYLTESYGEIKEQVEQHIPMCTLKMFPYNYDHVVQYARDVFEGYFNKIPSNIIKAKNELNSLKYNDVLEIYNDIKNIVDYTDNFDQCRQYAYLQWNELFNNQIDDVIKKYPVDHLNEDGTRFWSGNKIFPKKIPFDKSNQIDFNFIKSFAYIWANIFNIEIDDCENNSFNIFEKNIPKPVCSEELSLDDMKIMINKWIEKYTNISPIVFEKDDDTNHHIDFITALANKRALNYSIDPKDKHTTKGIAGKIIPAIATTTSVVSGLVSLELYKVIYGSIYTDYNNIDKYRYGSFNLAIQTFGFSESNNPSVLFELDNKKYTVWTKLLVDSNSSIIDFVENNENMIFKRNDKEIYVNIDSISIDDYIIYPNKSNDNDVFSQNKYVITLEQSDDNDEYDTQLDDYLTQVTINLIAK